MAERRSRGQPPLGSEGGPFEAYVPRFEIGRGNYGSVYLLQHPDGRKAVDKRIRLDTLGEKDRRQALAEIQLLRMLKHPNVVNFRHTFTSMPSEAGPGLWSGRHCELLHILMDYCDGGTLADVLSEAKKVTPAQPVPVLEARRWFRQCLLALAHLHEHRILHRDLKPANVLLCTSAEGRADAVLGDFGISRVLSPDTLLAQTTVGTPYYMSPEAISGMLFEHRPSLTHCSVSGTRADLGVKPASAAYTGSGYDGRSDVWSLGVILYELLSLRRPFPASSIGQLAIAISTNEPEALPQSAPADVAQL